MFVPCDLGLVTGRGELTTPRAVSADTGGVQHETPAHKGRFHARISGNSYIVTSISDSVEVTVELLPEILA